MIELVFVVTPTCCDTGVGLEGDSAGAEASVEEEEEAADDGGGGAGASVELERETRCAELEKEYACPDEGRGVLRTSQLERYEQKYHFRLFSIKPVAMEKSVPRLLSHERSERARFWNKI